MSVRLTPSLAELEHEPDERRVRAQRFASQLASQLADNQSELDEHEFQLKHDLGAVEVRRGPLSIARIVFNYSDSGRARVFSEVLGVPGNWFLSEALEDEGAAVDTFKRTLYDATRAFYRRKDEFRAFGLI